VSVGDGEGFRPGSVVVGVGSGVVVVGSGVGGGGLAGGEPDDGTVTGVDVTGVAVTDGTVTGGTVAGSEVLGGGALVPPWVLVATGTTGISPGMSAEPLTIALGDAEGCLGAAVVRWAEGAGAVPVPGTSMTAGTRTVLAALIT
jgi:hypothetical protein